MVSRKIEFYRNEIYDVFLTVQCNRRLREWRVTDGLFAVTRIRKADEHGGIYKIRWKEVWGNWGGNHRREPKVDCSRNQICLLLFGVKGVGDNGDTVVEGVRFYTCGHSQKLPFWFAMAIIFVGLLAPTN
jgi:hypothetical protein